MIYDLLAPIYDDVNKDIDYSAWADFIEEIVAREYRMGKPELVLDLGCGTGKMTMELGRRGFDMIGVDYSPEMLNIARGAAERAGLGKKMLWLCQDMCEFELYGTVDVTVSCLDSINHIISTDGLFRCFSLVHNYLIPEGLFIFDINGKHKFENTYGSEVYVMEEGNKLCIWQNDYNPKSRVCDFYITLMNEGNDGRYDRYDEVQREKMYTLKFIKSMLKKTGFEFIGAYADYDFCKADDNSDRLYIVARCKKEN